MEKADRDGKKTCDLHKGHFLVTCIKELSVDLWKPQEIPGMDILCYSRKNNNKKFYNKRTYIMFCLYKNIL